MRLLLAEDEAELAAVLSAALQSHDLVVDHVATLADAAEALKSNRYDALLLDRSLPDGDGLSLLGCELIASAIAGPSEFLLSNALSGYGSSQFLGPAFSGVMCGWVATTRGSPQRKVTTKCSACKTK